MAIYVTGDIHLNHDSAKLNTTFFPEGKNLTKDDYVIICGDCGFWWDYSKETRWWVNWYNDRPWTTLCVAGNHSNYDNIYGNYGLIDFHGGQARQVADSIYYLNNGDIYNLQGKKFFVMGGATSHDKRYRKEHISWWREEIPSVKMMEHGLDNLEKNGNKVDYILTHCAPTSIMTYYDPYGFYESDVLTDYLEEIDYKVDYKEWFHGHYHIDKDVDHVHGLYNRVVKIL